ncbi:hypothetical protein B566_EDAN008899 [Ephemera danica]|nr:hypothetical protein B566_EDAN008899 [Ephemera danica]
MNFVAAFLCLLVAVAAGDEECGVSPSVFSGPEVDPIQAEHVPWVGYIVYEELMSSYFCLPETDFDPDSLISKDTFVVATNFHEQGTEIYSGEPKKYNLTVRRTYVTSKNECQETYRNQLYDHAVCASGALKETRLDEEMYPRGPCIVLQLYRRHTSEAARLLCLVRTRLHVQCVDEGLAMSARTFAAAADVHIRTADALYWCSSETLKK